MEFSISDKYRLELHWARARYNLDNIVLLDECYFSGPVLREIWQLNQKDHIDLDFANQYIIFLDYFYIARLSWEGANHTTDKILLGNVTLKNLNLNVVPKLNDADYIVVDTKDHDDYKHQFNLVYPSYLIRNDGTLYDFRGMR